MDATSTNSSKVADLRAVGVAQRDALLWLVGAFVLYFAFPLLGVPYPYLFIAPIFVYWTFRISRALKDPMIVALVLAAISAVALIGLICLLILSVRATRLLRRAGIKVGILGPRLHDLPRYDSDIA
ncbi:MAG TPA: hypothetical protein VG758_15565 [Hyphomicrobiaceae bacterium]|jgi:hypothetical protein|nr:hypothetical protein [Hyphomicrobiaceae bacterium]